MVSRKFHRGWAKNAVDAWTATAAITHGPVFRAINKAGRGWGDGMSPKVLWDVVRVAAARAGIDELAPHDLRRTCARLCHIAGDELDRIQFLLGHVSIETTERYFGCKQRLRIAERPIGNTARADSSIRPGRIP
jgi:integrase